MSAQSRKVSWTNLWAHESRASGNAEWKCALFILFSFFFKFDFRGQVCQSQFNNNDNKIKKKNNTQALHFMSGVDLYKAPATNYYAGSHSSATSGKDAALRRSRHSLAHEDSGRQTNGNKRRSSKKKKKTGTQSSLRQPRTRGINARRSGYWVSRALRVRCGRKSASPPPSPPPPRRLMRNGNRLERSAALQGLRPSKHANNVVKGKHNNELIVLPECHNECESHYAQCF